MEQHEDFYYKFLLKDHYSCKDVNKYHEIRQHN